MLNPFQSAYTKFYSTETTLLSLHHHLSNAISLQQVSCLYLLDLSAAFDIIDHSNPTPSSFHLVWHFLCFTTMVHFISLIPHIYCRNPSTQFSLIPSYLQVSHGSVLGPVLFNLYITPLSSLISASSISHLLYANDTQFFKSFVPKNFSSAINNPQSTITLISSWMSSNYLTLNPSKTEFLLIGLPQQTSKIVNPSLSLPTTIPIIPSLSAKNLDFIFDSTLSLSKQISSLSSGFHYHIRDLRRIRHTLDSTTTTTIATALVHSRIDYCNCLYHGLPITQIKRLRHIQNGFARAVTRTPIHSHIAPVLKSLHWLKVEQRIQYKIIFNTHNHLHITEPKYLHRLTNIKPSSRTRSSDHLCLSLPPVSTGSSLEIDHSAPPLPAYGTLYQ